jgi:hypothetical protein
MFGISATAALAIGAGAVAATSAYGSYKAGKAADKATDSQERIAGQQLDMSKEALDWEKQKYADEAPARTEAAAQGKKVSDALLTGMQLATDQAKDYDAYSKGTFRPVEQNLVADAVAYDTPMRRTAAAESAMAGVDSSAASINAARNRELGRAGIAPGSTKSIALAEDSAVAQSKVRAAAGTGAVNNVEAQGVARRMDAASLGRNLPSAQATQQQIATTSGTASANTGMQSLLATQSGKGDVMQGYGVAQRGFDSAGGMYAGIAKNYSQQAADMAATAGNAVSMGVKNGWFSDEDIKSDTGTPANTKKALQEIVDTPVEDGWRYDPAKGGPDDGGTRHIGPMAQQVQRISGEDAAPGGKVISAMDEMGRMRAAIQELAKRQDKTDKPNRRPRRAQMERSAA